MDILLINAPVKRIGIYASSSPPLGLAYIASVLINAGYSVSARDLNISGLNPLRLKRILEEGNPKILGISCHTKTYPGGLRAARLAKEVLPDITVVMGGPHVTVVHEEVAREMGVDVVVQGEGEYTMLELANYIIRGEGNLSMIKGITYREDGAIKTTPERPFIENPEELPFPARGLFPMPLYELPGTVLMSRGGCPFDCPFCAVNSIWKGSRRFRNAENVAAEILSIFRNYQIEEVSFVDDTFTLDRQRVVELCNAAKKLRQTFRWRWKCATRIDLVDPELLRMMYHAGCYSITFGVESGSQMVLDSLGKNITLSQVRNSVKSALETGMIVTCAFMFPHATDTEETVREQRHFMADLVKMGARLSLALTAPYPGTRIYDHANKLGVNILARTWDEYSDDNLMISTRNLSEQRLQFLLQEFASDVSLYSMEV